MTEICDMQSRMTAPVTLLLLMILQMSLGSASEGVVEAIESARKLYETGDLEGSLNALDGAADLIKDQRRPHTRDLFPEPLEGWSADAPQVRSDPATVAIAGTNVSRRYFREDGSQVKLALLVDPPTFSFLSMAVLGPGASAENDGLTPYSLGQWNGRLEHTAPGSYAITLVVGDRLIVQARGFGISDPQILTQYLEALNVNTVLERFDRD
jgi:hypothetical protein